MSDDAKKRQKHSFHSLATGAQTGSRIHSVNSGYFRQRSAEKRSYMLDSELQSSQQMFHWRLSAILVLTMLWDTSEILVNLISNMVHY